MKTPEELSPLKEEVEVLNKKLVELTEDELTQVTRGRVHKIRESLEELLECYERMLEGAAIRAEQN